jgi:hypothetical protein
MEVVKDSMGVMCVGSVLIVTMTFGVTFAVPGGYIADDHNNGGTPILARRYAFDALIASNTLAFVYYHGSHAFWYSFVEPREPQNALNRNHEPLTVFDYKLDSCLCTWCICGASSGDP